MMNINAHSLIINEIYELFDYLAYGSGEAEDNATSLETEIGRAALVESTAYATYFENIYNISDTSANGEILLEYGLATESTGNVHSIFINYPMEKNDNYEILVTIKVLISNL